MRPHGLYSLWDSPGQNPGVGSCSLLQGIFPTQGLNPGLPHCRRSLYQLSHQGSPVGGLQQPCPNSCAKTSCCWSCSQSLRVSCQAGGGQRGRVCSGCGGGSGVHTSHGMKSPGRNCQRLVSFSETYRKRQVEIKGSKFNKNANSFSHQFLII